MFLSLLIREILTNFIEIYDMLFKIDIYIYIYKLKKSESSSMG